MHPDLPDEQPDRSDPFVASGPSGPSGPFVGSTSGLTRQRLRARRYAQVSRDVYVLSEQAGQLAERCRALLLAVPDAALSHATAAQLLALPVRPDPLLHLTRPAGVAVTRRRGVCAHVRALDPSELLTVQGLRTTDPARTFLDLAERLGGEDLVAVADVVARRTGLDALRATVGACPPRRGLVAARAAVALADPGADSPAETRTRLLLHAGGFRGLVHGVQVVDDTGGWLAAPDLADPEARVAVQYDGLVHLTRGPERWRRDVDRDELTRQAGWELVVLTALDLRVPGRALAKVAAAYARAAARRA